MLTLKRQEILREAHKYITHKQNENNINQQKNEIPENTQQNTQ
jgi:hypothetical protein